MRGSKQHFEDVSQSSLATLLCSDVCPDGGDFAPSPWVTAARPDDDPLAIAKLIFQTAPHSYDYIFDGDRASCLRFIADQWVSENGQYSHTRASVARFGERVVGVEIGGTVDEWDTSERSDVRDAMTESIGNALQEESWQWFATSCEQLSHLMVTVPRDIYYLQILSVSRSFQGYGLGKSLLEAAADKALERQLHGCYLDVFSGNRAAGFYQKMGFRKAEKTKPLGLSRTARVPSMIRMVRYFEDRA